MEPKCSLWHSQKWTLFWAKWIMPDPLTPYFFNILMLSFDCCCISEVVFSFKVFQPKFCMNFSFLPSIIHLILHDLILLMFDKKYKIRSSSLCFFLSSSPYILNAFLSSTLYILSRFQELVLLSSHRGKPWNVLLDCVVSYSSGRT
jgi:hypothetical protein